LFNKRSAIKSMAGVAVGIELVSLGNVMKDIANDKNSVPPIEPELTEEYEFVFYEQAIKAFNVTIAALLEAVVMNEVEVDNNIIEEAKKMLRMFEWLLEQKKKEEENGN